MTYLLAFLIVAVGINLIRLFFKEKELGIDLLNDFSLLSELQEKGITDLKIFRKRENSYLNRPLGYQRLIPLENKNNSFNTGRSQYNVVCDTEILIKGLNLKGNEVIIKKYEHNKENIEKAFLLKEEILKMKE